MVNVLVEAVVNPSAAISEPLRSSGMRDAGKISQFPKGESPLTMKVGILLHPSSTYTLFLSDSLQSPIHWQGNIFESHLADMAPAGQRPLDHLRFLFPPGLPMLSTSENSREGEGPR